MDRITKKELNNKIVYNKLINMYLNPMLDEIDSLIKKNNANELTYCIYEPQKRFEGVDKISQIDCQFILYERIIYNLESRGFTVVINSSAEDWKISWDDGNSAVTEKTKKYVLDHIK